MVVTMVTIEVIRVGIKNLLYQLEQTRIVTKKLVYIGHVYQAFFVGSIVAKCIPSPIDSKQLTRNPCADIAHFF